MKGLCIKYYATISIALHIFKYKYNYFFRTVVLIILQLQSNLSKPAAPEDLIVQNSRPSGPKVDNVAFIAKTFNISEFQDDEVVILLREFKEKRRRKREALAIEVDVLASGATYRVAQVNNDSSGVGSTLTRSYLVYSMSFI